MIDPEKNKINALINTSVNKYQAGDPNALNEVYEYLLSFCRRVISKTCGKYINANDDEAAIIPNVILDVLEKYNSDRGSFMVYLGQAVRNRTIDGMRKTQRTSVISFSDLGSESNLVSKDEIFFENIIDDITRKQEIEIFKKLLSEFGLSFEQLAKISPRQSKTRAMTQKVGWLISQDQELSDYLISKKMLPNRLIAEKYDIKRSILDRYRKYIIAVVLIIINDLTYLKAYILPSQREETPWQE